MPTDFATIITNLSTYNKILKHNIQLAPKNIMK